MKRRTGVRRITDDLKTRRRPEKRKNHCGRLRYMRARWKRLRQLVLHRDQHLCQQCLKSGRREFGNEIDHILPWSERDDLFYSQDNLQTLCSVCHGRKTAEGK